MHGALQAEERRLTDLVVWSVIASYIIGWCVIGASALQFHRYKRLIPPAAQSHCSTEQIHVAAFQGNMVSHIVVTSLFIVSWSWTYWSREIHGDCWMDCYEICSDIQFRIDFRFCFVFSRHQPKSELKLHLSCRCSVQFNFCFTLNLLHRRTPLTKGYCLFFLKFDGIPKCHPILLCRMLKRKIKKIKTKLLKQR